ncbi:MAG: M12 family metallo-peptidase [Myxococcaceae bacterium]
MRVLLLAAVGLVLACGPTAGDFGSACSGDSDCTTGACFKGFPDGYCSQRCENQACPSGSYCSAFAEGSFCLQTCSSSAFDCRSGYHCADASAGAVCYPDCSKDSDCGPGAACSSGECVGGSPGKIGDSCRLNVGCASGRCEIAYNGGYCTQPCGQTNGSGTNGASCPSPAQCAQASESGGLCFSGCGKDGDCRADYYCDAAGNGTQGVCRPKCRGNATCGLGFTCGSDGRCNEGSAAPRKTGARCGADSDCDSSYCLDQPNTDFPKGVCSADCTNNAGACGSDGLCIVPSDPNVASVCLQKCDTNFDCRQEYFCSEVQGSSARVCIPRCTAVPLCNSPEVCDQYSGDCVPPSAVGSASIQRVDVGDMAISGDQSSKDFSIDVPSDAKSFTIVMGGGVGGTSAISRLTSPSGELLFDLNDYLNSKVRILPVNDGDFGMLFPNSPRVDIASGKYNFSIVNEKGSGTGHVSVLFKRANGTLAGGKLNLNLWFAGVTGVTAASAPTDSNIQAMLTEFKNIYATAGIQLGSVSYFDVPAGQAATFATIDTTEGKDSELRKLFEISAGAPNNAMNFFLVKEIKGAQPGFTILGIAGGIPGIPFEQGTNASGVAVTTADLASNPASVARTMAHEGGHWLGLWHTTEQNGKLFDPLPDTPECSPSNDANNDEILTSAECSNGGADYLMFWEAGPTASKLSGNQGFVLQRNPVVTNP